MRFAFAVFLVVLAFGLQAAIGSTIPHLKSSALDSSHIASLHGVTGEGGHAEEVPVVPLCCEALLDGHTADGSVTDCPAFCLALSDAPGITLNAMKSALEPTLVRVARPANPRPVDPPPIST